jgi:hypothetical protein
VVELRGKAYSHSDKGSLILVNIGAEYPDQLLTVVLRGAAKSLAANIDGNFISVSGTVMEYKGKPEIVVTDAAQIHLIPVVGMK